MSRIRNVRRLRLPVMVWLVAYLALAPLGVAFAQTPDATLQGTFIDQATQKPLEGIRAVIKDLTTGTTVESSPSDDAGRWSVTVPAGRRYQIVGMTREGGVQQDVVSSPMSARIPGVYEFAPILVVVREAAQKPAPAAEKPAPKPAPRTAEKVPAPKPAKPAPVATTKSAASKPAWKKPGAIVGYVAGGVAIIALASSGGGNGGGNASPSTPGR